MSVLPNPFEFAVGIPTVDSAAASICPPARDAAANRFVLNEELFLAVMEPMPIFLQAPIEALQILARFA